MAQSFERHGKTWKAGTTDIKVELDCYLKTKDGAKRYFHFERAFRLMWPEFQWHEWFEMEMRAWCNEREFTAIGHTRASKTYGLAYIIVLDWLAAMDNTLTTVSSMSLDRLRDTIGRDIIKAIKNMSYTSIAKTLEIRNTKNTFRIFKKPIKSQTKAEQELAEASCIVGIAVDSGGTAKIQGRHDMRRRTIGDEVAEFPDTYFLAEKNARSADDYRSVHLANPCQKYSSFGMLCEPLAGWGSVDENTKSYRAKNGRLILHFNGLQSRNLLLWAKSQDAQDPYTIEEYRKDEWKWMIRPGYIFGGEDENGNVEAPIDFESVEWYMYVVGWFAPDGMVNSVFPEAILDPAMADEEFPYRPVRVGMLDPAYEYDQCVLQIMEYGEMSDGFISMMCVKTIAINTKVAPGSAPKEHQIGQRVKEACDEHGITADNFIADATGNGNAVCAYLESELGWGKKIHRCMWNEGATERPITASENEIAKDLFMYFVDELHFRARAWFEAKRVHGIGRLHKRTLEELNTRRYSIKKTKRVVETKDQVKKRIHRSPDYSDALILFAELMARKNIYPGGIKNQHESTVDRWGKHKERAKKASKRYTNEFSHGDGWTNYKMAA